MIDNKPEHSPMNYVIKNPVLIQEIINFFDDADFNDLFIISKFYFTKQPFPNDTTSFIFIEFCDQVKTKLKITSNRAIRFRLDRIVDYGILQKLGENPIIYAPHDNKKFINAIREIVQRKYAFIKESSDKVFNSPDSRV